MLHRMVTTAAVAVVAEVLPDSASVAKDLGVMNIAGGLPLPIGVALAPMVLAADEAGSPCCPRAWGALARAGAILRVGQVR